MKSAIFRENTSKDVSVWSKSHNFKQKLADKKLEVYFCVRGLVAQFYWGGTQWRSWLRHCATCRKVMSSIPFDVTGNFHSRSSSSRIMAMGFDSTSNSNEYQEYFLG